MRVRTSNLLDVAAQFSSSIVGRGLYLVLQVVLARYLGPRGFGLYAVGWTVAGLVGTLAPVGMPQAMLRFGIGGRAALTAPPMIVATATGAAVTVLLFALAGPIAAVVFGDPSAAPVIRAFAPAVLLLNLFGVMSAALRVSGAMLLSALVSAVLFALYLAFTCVAFLPAPSAVAAAHMYPLAVLATLVPTSVLLWNTASVSGAPMLRPLLHFGVVTMFIHSANVLNIWADRVVIGIMSNPEAVGVYQVASQLAMVVIVLRTAVTTVFESTVPKTATDGKVPDVTREFVSACRVLLHVSAPGLVVLAVTAGFWVRLLFGTPFLAASAPLVILVVGQLLLTFTGPAVTALHMTGEERRVMLLTTGSCVLNLIGNVALIPFFGSSGAAFASVVANFLVCLACLARLVRSGRLRFSFDWLRDIALGTALCAAVSLFLADVVGRMSVPAACGMLVAAYLIYGIVVCLACSVEDETMDFIRASLRRLRRRPVSS